MVLRLVFKTLIEEAKKILQEAGVGQASIELTKNPDFGEVSSTSAFDLARRNREKPSKVAWEICEKIRPKEGLIKKVEPHPSGYINFYADWTKFGKLILETIAKENGSYGRTLEKNILKFIVEHTAVNPNKALHIGHARNVCLGDTLVRLLKQAGHEVIVANYIDDSGTQMAELLLGFRKLSYNLSPTEGLRFDEYCGDRVYVEVVKKVQQDSELEKEMRTIVKELERRDSEVSVLNREISLRVLKDQLKTCSRLGASYQILNKETDIIAKGLWEEIFKKLSDAKAVYYQTQGEKANCWLIDLSKHETLSKEGDEIMVRSDGTTTYVARDIAYAAWKMGLLDLDFTYSVLDAETGKILISDMDGQKTFPIGNVSRVITVVDARQRRPQEIVRYALSKIGASAENYLHFSYEVVSLNFRDARKLGVDITESKFVQMKGREGLYIKAETILNLIKDKALTEVQKRHPDWKADKSSEVAEELARSALRYTLVKSDADKMIVFDTDEALRLDGDTGPYLQYSYARALHIMQKAPKPVVAPTPELLQKGEIDLLRRMSLLPLVIESTVNDLLLKKIANYGYELAVSFNNFYEKYPVLTSKEPLLSFRIRVVSAFVQVFEIVLKVLGLTPLVEM